ncbi:structural maintenance of chromosomes protein 6 isoform X2 [Denticeps clupeoides]|uniref:structural maintenance of chromosomes protein 6 isoform X2 n=1 Tax=Denticeps clupeoides TaxID=299321 RepID=UPI0010A3163B|nr:structural maintenance of chromosomes protein 6 isoform X2 [Denticeps clupeoides]
MSKRKSDRSDGTPHKRAKSSHAGEQEEDVANLRPASHSVSGEVGIIEKISLKNFMCHALLGPFAFGDNVNFVVGNNGSGKSAVLTALIVALGGKAQATNRGSSLKGFVKEGESSADVSIALRNRGEDAFKPEVYGQTITVDVRISSEGLRTYKLKSRNGQIVSTKKEELVAILDHFNIQVDNPVSILTQEMSKHFLHSKSEEDKYKFFMKATQLEQMKEDYKHIMKTRTYTKTAVEGHEESLDELKRKYQEKEERYKSLSSIDTMNKKLEDLQHHMVTELENEMKPVKDNIENDEKFTVKFDQKIEEWKAKVEEIELRYKQNQERLDQVSVQVDQLQPQCAQIKSQVQERRNDVKKAEAFVHRLKTNLRDLEKDKEQLTKRIDELKFSISQATAADSQKRMEKLRQLQGQLDAKTFTDSTLGQQIDQFQTAVATSKDELDKMRREEQDIQHSVSSKERNLRAMENSRNSHIRRFGENMPALLAAVDDAHHRRQFRRKPLGPLGFCICLKDPELAVAVESCLKSLMLAFCCDNHRDEALLQSLMSRYFKDKRPQIIVSEFTDKRYNVEERAVHHPEFPTVLQVLEIDDPVVSNCLIDMRGIETILLIKGKKEARRVMQSGHPPQNCREAFTKEGDQVYANRYYSSDVQRALYLSGDLEEEIRHLRVALENQQAHMHRYKQHIQEVEADIRNNSALLKTAYDNRKNVKDCCRRLLLEISELQNVEEPQSEDLRPLEDDLNEISEKLQDSKKDFEKANQDMAQQKRALEEAEKAYRQKMEIITNIAEEAEPIKEELSKNDQELEKCKHHRKHFEDKRKVHLSKIQELKHSLQQKEKEVKSAIVKATQICPERLEVKRTAKSLDSEISRLKGKISAHQEQQGDRDVIIREYQEAAQNYSTISRQVKCLKRFNELLYDIMCKRHAAYSVLRRYLSVRCKYYFNATLSQRGYKGRMTFDHGREALSISVQPGEKEEAVLNDMRSLSGGERSFSTVCFVLSLWAISDAPFRCLDEFDVFMDMVNRRLSMDMMLKLASSQRYRQFIFLTPQSMSSIPENNLIRILRLNDPDRTQTTLSFGQTQ